MEVAMFEKKCETQDLIRSIRTDIINFAGMGASKKYSPQEIMSIPVIDNQFIIVPIKTIEEALKLLKTFE